MDDLFWLRNRQGQYWQTAEHGFLVALNGIKIRCSYPILMFTLETLYEIEINFLDTFYINDCLVGTIALLHKVSGLI